ncbi:MAG: YlzJ-like family protein [Ignavibacteriales bacterium]
MILYTVMPVEEVMQQDEKRRTIEIRVRGRIIQVEPVSPTEGRVVRVISTDPQDFLDPATQPGSLVSLWGGAS